MRGPLTYFPFTGFRSFDVDPAEDRALGPAAVASRSRHTPWHCRRLRPSVPGDIRGGHPMVWIFNEVCASFQTIVARILTGAPSRPGSTGTGSASLQRIGSPDHVEEWDVASQGGSSAK